MGITADGVTIWQDQAGRYPLLPPDETLRLGRVIQSPETSQKNRERAVKKLVTHNLKLIPQVVRNVLGPKRSFKYGDSMTEDLLQIAVIGLERAAHKYDPTTGYKFSTYAYYWIYQSVTRYLYDNISAIRVPESTLRDYYKLEREIGAADFSKMDEKERKIAERLLSAHRALNTGSLDIKVNKSGDSDELDLLSLVQDAGSECNASDNYERLVELAKLTSTQRKVMDLIFVCDMNWTDVGRQLGLSRDKIRTVYYGAMKKLRSVISR